MATLYVGVAVLGLGAANLWTTVLSYISSLTDTEKRPMVISGYLFQVTAVNCIGIALLRARFAPHVKKRVALDVHVNGNKRFVGALHCTLTAFQHFVLAFRDFSLF